ncbi:exported hypothetical protein [Candidatus Sulfotelmatomonas gaucii]|uniref:Uncharacterized protein n=1 Tax=Candidatus Sulfuritelmatomonas gaucii TaxID=2043161 RepID=A0A2N9L519_9BACT|nr:exported hypothetical protein [Candidatus Sulfotelmatomonas gaucii]
MKKQTKIRLAWWVGFPLSLVAMRFIAGGRAWDYLVDHLWLTAVLPLVVLFLLLFARGMYMQHRRQPGGNPKMGSAHRAKP